MDTMSMKDRAHAEVGKKPKSEIVELALDTAQSTNGHVEGLGDDFTHLEALSACSCGLTTLKHFPKLSALKRLDLTDNKIADGLDALAAGAPHLEQLSLASNMLSKLDDLKPLAGLKGLQQLDLLENPLSETETYREDVFKMFPKLEYLDGFNANNEPNPNLEDYLDEEEEDAEEEDGEEEVSDSEGRARAGNARRAGVGLSALVGDDLPDDDEDDEDFDAGEDGDDDEDGEEEDGEEAAAPKGKKRRHDEEEADDDEDE